MATASPSLLLPFGAACLGIALFAAMDATLKAVSIAIGAYSVTLWRAAMGTGLGALLFLARRLPWPGPAALRLHALRGAVTAVMALLFFWGIARIPIAEAIAISFVAPLIALFLAAAVLGERIRAPAIAGALLGTAGVGAILFARARGGFGGPEALPGALAVFASAVFYAVNIVLMRKQALIAAPLEVAFFQNLATLAWLAPAAPIFALPPGPRELPAIAIGAGLAFASLLLLSWAYRRAEAQALIAVEYTAFGWAALFGWLFYDEQLTWPVLAGTALIVCGCVVASRRRPGAGARMEAAI